jgi:hypothetical protein
VADDRIEWNTQELQLFAKSLNADKNGRKLKLHMQSQFDSITETFRDRLRQGVANLPGAGTYPSELAESVTFKTKIIGGRKARVSIVGEGRTREGKWREVGKLLDNGFLYHPAWGHWRSSPPPNYLRQEFPAGPRMVDNVLDRSEPVMREEILFALNFYLDRLTDIRKGI